MGKTDFLQDAVDARNRNVVWELSHENGGDDGNAAREIEDGIEVVLFNVNGVCRAGFEAVAAVDAFVGQEDGFALADADGFGRARFHAMRAADASIFID